MPTIPKMMKAAAIDRSGGPKMLKLHTLPVPGIAADEILIAVHTAGVGPWDADIRAGWSPSGKPPKFPLVIGSDGAGVIVAVGKNVRRFRVGEKAYSFIWERPKGGFYAQYVAVPAKMAALVPRQLDLRQAGAIPVTGLTALQGLDALHLKKGESLIIHAATGGVGTMAIQLAKLRGVRVLAIASGKDGVALAKRLGADQAIDGHRGDIAAATRKFAPQGVDAILAFAGGKELSKCLDALRSRG
ncbi:MAG TPA: NADP-dependent oxidoreductase, partial [Tepidisphaeraceae bacterium]